MIALSSNSWINIWLAIEINLISFIPQIFNKINSLSIESIIIYFLSQTIASINFLFFLLLITLNFKWFNQFNINFSKFILNLTIFIKLRRAPFYFWIPKVIKNISWNNCLILTTWQKLIPIIILYNCIIFNLINFSIILSALISCILGVNQNNIKLLIAFSSLNHLSWIFINLIININLWTFYFIIYALLNSLVIISFNFLKIFNLNQFFNLKINFYLKIILSINFISLAGMPPLLGFLPKWLTINVLILNSQYSIIFILIFTSIIRLFYYFRICYSSFIITNFEFKWINFNYSYNFFLRLLIISITTLIFSNLYLIYF